MRLIDADELMEHVYMDRLDSRDLIAEMVRNAPTVEPERKWIPCSERLPDNTDLVFVSIRDEMGDTSFDYSAPGWITPNKEYWIVDGDINNYVIAWMPLPKAYKGE